MPQTLTFLHTSPVHIETFGALLQSLAPDIPARHIVDESLLQDAWAAGEITPALTDRIQQTIIEAADNEGWVILCTCSTIGGCAEATNLKATNSVLRVDRPMVEAAVGIGPRIIVAATLKSTIAPTRALLLTVAKEAGKTIALTELICEGAWAKFEAGDQAGYLQEIAQSLQQAAAEADVIVLAQASMADATKLCPDLPIPVLSSPQLGVEAAIRAYRRVTTA